MTPSTHRSLTSTLRQGFQGAICFLHFVGRAVEGIFTVYSLLEELLHHSTMATGELALAFHSSGIQHEDTLFLGNKIVNNNTVQFRSEQC